MDYLNTYKRLLALADAGLFYGKDAFDARTLPRTTRTYVTTY